MSLLLHRLGRAMRFLGLAAALLAAPLSGHAADPTPTTPETPRGSEPGEDASERALDVTVGLPAPSTRDIPWDRLEQGDYDLVRDVVAGATASSEVSRITFRSRKPVFEYLLDHLDFAADVARMLRQGKYRVRRAGDGYEADDGYGTTGTIRPVFAGPDRRIFYLAGRYDTPLLPTIPLRAVLLLDAGHAEGPDGATYCDLHVAGHVRFDSRAAEAVAWIARNYTEAQVDRQVRRFFRHVAAVSRRAYDDPETLAEDLSRRPDLPAQRVAEFREVLLAHLPPAWSETQRYQLIEPLAPPAASE